MKTLLWIAALLTVGALCFALQEHRASSRARERSASLRPDVIRLEGHLKLRRAALQRKQVRLADLQKSAAAGSEAAVRMGRLNEETAAMDAESIVLTGAWNEALHDLRAAVDSERRKATGEPAVDLALPSGTVLRHCRVKALSDGALTIEHEAGVHRLRADEAPPEWIDRFALNWALEPAARAPALPEDAEMVESPAPPTFDSPSSPPSVIVTDAETAPDTTRINQIRRDVAALELRITRTWHAIDQHWANASYAARRHASARIGGRISAHLPQVQSSTRAALAARDSLAADLARLRALRAELETMAPVRRS